MPDGGADEFIDLVANRAELLEALAGDPARKGDVLDRLGVSRSTVDRATRKLRDAGLVERTGTRFVTTAAGRVALANYRQYRRRARDAAGATEVLSRLPPEATPDIRIVEGAEPVVAADPAPYRPMERLHEAVAEADEYRAVLPRLDAPRHVRLLYDLVVTEGGSAEVVVPPDLFDSLRAEFPRQLAAMADTGRFELFVGETPPYGLVRVDDGTEPTAALVAFSEESTVAGLLRNETAPAVDWAADRLKGIRDGADRATGRLGTDGSGPDTPRPPDVEGFVRLSDSFFLDRRVADPVTAWRTGLDLAEVWTGYSVDRTRPADGDRRSLTAALCDRLADGTDVALVGRPGCGKSTVCKRVACEWHGEDRGTVLYRDGDRGGQFEDVDALVAAVDAGEDHRLVVVEDAVRPDARAVFEAMGRLTDREDVSFLLDAREAEWRDPPGDGLPAGAEDYRADAVETVPMPSLDDYDRGALLDHVERTVPEVSMPADEFDTTPGDDTESPAPGEPLLLLHRAARYADASADGATTLEDDVADLYERLADAGEEALDVGVLVNLLNAADIGVDPTALRALDDGGTVERLEGRVLFEADDRGYRTVHEAWSATFLEHVYEADPTAEAAGRFGRCVTDALALPERLADRSTADGTPASRVPDAPREWAANAAERLFELGVRYPKLAPLYGEPDGDAIEFPDAVDEATRLRCLALRGEMSHLAGRYDVAAAAYRRLRDRTRIENGDGSASLHLEALIGVAAVAESRGEYETATECAERALEGAERAGGGSLEARATVLLGRLRRDAGEMDAAAADFEAALGTARERGDRSVEVEALLERGLTATHGGEYDRGIEYNREALALARELGDRENQNRAAGELGLCYLRTGATDEAATWVRRSLEIAREMGDSQAESAELTRLGLIEIRRGNYGQARQRFEAAADIERATGNERDAKLSLLTLGKANYYCGDLETAAEYAERGLEAAEEMDMPRAVASGRTTLARIARERGDHEAARTHADVAVGASRDADLGGFEADALCVRGRVERERGDHEGAESDLKASRELAAEMGETQSVGRAALEEGRLAADRGDHGRARQRFETALDSLEAAGATRLALRARLELADACRAAGADAEAARHCEAGREAATDAGFADLRAAFDDRLDALG